MRSKHAVWLLGLVLIACALPGAATASTSRLQSLGLQGDYVLDYANVATYPSAIVRYQNLVYGDLGVKDATGGDLSDFTENNQPPISNADRGMGLILGNLFGGKIGTFGVYLNENAAAFSPALGAQYFNRNQNEAWNIVWGYKFSNIALGLELNHSYSAAEDTVFLLKPYEEGFSLPDIPDGTADNARQLFNLFASQWGSVPWNTLGFGAGMSFDWEADGRSNFFDLSAEVRQNQLDRQADKGDPAALVYEDDCGLSFAFNGRGHIETSDNVHLVPVLNYYRLDMSLKRTVGDPLVTTSFDNTFSGLNLGLAGQWKLREGDWLTLGLAYQNVVLDVQTAKVEYSTIPNVFAALESNLWSWFTLRMGASKPWYSELKLTGSAADAGIAGLPGFSGETKVKDSPFQYSLGAGFHLGRVDLDAVINQDFPFSGSYMGSGNSEVPFTRLSATYRW